MNNRDELIESFKVIDFKEYLIRDMIDGLLSAVPLEDRAIVEELIYGESIKGICKKYNKTRTYVKRLQSLLQRIYKTNKY